MFKNRLFIPRWKGVRKREDLSIKYFKKGCDLKDPHGCNSLGLEYEFGANVKKNVKKAKELYGKACDLGLQTGCERFAEINK